LKKDYTKNQNNSVKVKWVKEFVFKKTGHIQFPHLKLAESHRRETSLKQKQISKGKQG